MKILLLNWIDPGNPQAGGAEVHLKNVFGRMVENGHEITLISSGWPGCQGRVNVDGIEVHRLGTRHTLSMLAPAYYRQKLSEQSFDLVVEDLNKVPFFSPLWSKVPVTLLVHHLFGFSAFRGASFPVALLSCLLEMPIPLIFRNVPTIAVSRSTSEDLIKRGMSSDQITVIPNGIDYQEFTPSPISDRFTEPTLLYLGRLKAYKRVDIILRAIARLKNSGVTCRLLIAGDGDYRHRLNTLSKTLGIESNVQFLGFVSEAEKLKLLRKSWIHVLTSSKEGWGITNLEAAACGTPTIASDSPGLRDSVLHEKTGFLVPHGNHEAVANRMVQLFDDITLRINMGQTSRAFAEQFSWEKSAIAVEELLQQQVDHFRVSS